MIQAEKKCNSDFKMFAVVNLQNYIPIMFCIVLFLIMMVTTNIVVTVCGVHVGSLGCLLRTRNN